jgi:hypothetical protein
VLLDKEQKFAVIADSANLLPSMKFVVRQIILCFCNTRISFHKGREIEDGKSNWLPQKQKPIQQNGQTLSLKAIKTFNNTGRTLLQKSGCYYQRFIKSDEKSRSAACCPAPRWKI